MGHEGAVERDDEQGVRAQRARVEHDAMPGPDGDSRPIDQADDIRLEPEDWEPQA
jgi:hypothetical protein